MSPVAGRMGDRLARRPYARRVCTAARWKIESVSPREEEVSLTAEGGRSQCARCLPTFKLRFGGKVAALRPRAQRLGSFARSPSPPFPFHLLEPGLRSSSGSPRHLLVIAALASFPESLLRLEQQDATGA